MFKIFTISELAEEATTAPNRPLHEWREQTAEAGRGGGGDITAAVSLLTVKEKSTEDVFGRRCVNVSLETDAAALSGTKMASPLQRCRPSLWRNDSELHWGRKAL